MSLVREFHQRSKRFHAEIARRASTVVQKEDQTFCVPNAPFGETKIGVKRITPPVPESDLHWWKSMWFYDLVTYAPIPEAPLNVTRIQHAVCAFYQISKLDITSARREAKIVRPRQVAMYLSRIMTTRTFPDIGRFFGGRDHTTVIHAVRKITSLIESDKDFSDQIEAVKAAVLA